MKTSEDIVLKMVRRLNRSYGMLLIGEALGDAVENALRDAVAEEREACIKDVCPVCASGAAAFELEGVWLHEYDRGGKKSRGACAAAAIRARGAPS